MKTAVASNKIVYLLFVALNQFVVYLYKRTMLKNMCRVCGRYAALKESLRIFDNKDVLWSIQVLTGLTLENAKCLPDLICTFCQTELREAIGFSDRVIAAQQQLLTALAEEELKDVSEEYRTAVMELASNSCEKSFNISNSGTQSESDEELILKPQLEADEMSTEEHRRQDELLEYDIIIDDEAVIQEAEVQEIRASEAMEHHTDEPQCAIDVATTEDYVLTDKEWNEECVVSSRELNEEIAAPQIEVKKKRARKGLGNIIFVCDECGIHISGRMAFELHCRRHRGDKQFPCEVCQDRFCTSSELKSHMRRHTGERPFACQYCERSFADNSSRIKHQRTHTNERPYACTSCGKAFTAPYILKNHMLIHSGERAFSCELCNKTFRRHTHLVTHFRSSAHKRKRERQNKEIKNTS